MYSRGVLFENYLRNWDNISSQNVRNEEKIRLLKLNKFYLKMAPGIEFESVKIGKKTDTPIFRRLLEN